MLVRTKSASPRRRVGAIALAVATLVTVSFAATMVTITCRWAGPYDGLWSNAANWVPAGNAPNNGAGGQDYNVWIDDNGIVDSSCVLDMTATIDGMTIDRHDQLVIGNSRTLTIRGGPVTNEGLIRLDATGNVTQFMIDGDVLLTGAGTFRLSDWGHNKIFGSDPADRLTNDAAHWIRGSGRIADTDMSLTNRGTIDADQPTELTVRLAPPPQSHFNPGVMQASADGTLRIRLSEIDNRGGLIQALDDAVVLIENSDISGGTVHTEGAGIVRLLLGSLLVDLTTTAQIEIPDTAYPSFRGTITNDGEVEVQGATGNATLWIEDAATFTGAGSIQLTNSTWSRIRGNGPAARLTHDANHTISGTGRVGDHLMSLTNHGRIVADQPTELVVGMSGNQEHFNTGSMYARAGGTLRVAGTRLLNSGGFIGAEAGATVILETAQIVDGELITESTGRFLLTSFARLENVTSSARISIPDGESARLAGVITNSGVLELNGRTALTTLEIYDPVTTLTGAGAVHMTDPVWDRITGTLHHLVNDVDHTISGAGKIDGISLTNRGTITADEAAVLEIDPPTAGDFTNEGELYVTSGSTLSIKSGPFSSIAWVRIDTGGVLERDGIFPASGTNAVSGILSASSFELLGGTLIGAGRVIADVENDGWVKPGGSIAAGVLNVVGDYSQDAFATLSIKLTGTMADEYDVLAISDDALLDGALEVRLIDPFEPTTGDEFTFLTAGRRLDGKLFLEDCGGRYRLDYEPGAVVLVTVNSVLDGDVNCDGRVNFGDLLVILGKWGDCPGDPRPCPGDLNDSGGVDFGDILLILGNWS